MLCGQVRLQSSVWPWWQWVRSRPSGGGVGGRVRAGTGACWAFAKVSTQRPPRQAHASGIWVPGGVPRSQPSLLSAETASQAQASSPEPACPGRPAGTKNPKHPEWTLLPLAPVLWPALCTWLAVSGREAPGGADPAHRRASLKEKGGKCPLGQCLEKQAWGRGDFQGHFVGAADAQQGRLQTGPKLLPPLPQYPCLHKGGRPSHEGSGYLRSS